MHRHRRAARALALAVLLTGGAALWPVAVVQPAFASRTYTWSLICAGTDKNGGEGGCNVSWNWTQNGAVIPNPASGPVLYNSGFSCQGNCSGGSSASTFVQPDTANGITATLAVCVPVPGGSQCNTQTATQSFAPGSSVFINLPASIDVKVSGQCFPGYPCGGSTRLDEAAVFKLNS